jgi:hypothetical protein
MNFPDFSNETGGDVLILNGDILVAAYLDPIRTDKEALRVQKYLREHFIPELLNKFPFVIYECGNHEHYRYDINQSMGTIRNWFEKAGVDHIIYMDNDHADIGGVRFVGSTLWSNFLNEDPIAMWEAGRGMNDFRIIMDGPQVFTPEEALRRHQVSVEYIMKATDTDMPVVVATHHAPTALLLNPHHSGSLLDGAYFTDLSWIMEARPNIKYWISGHTHAIDRHKIHNTECVSNCRGYYTEVWFKAWKGLNTLEV